VTVDLHTHSSRSDGALDPAALVSHAAGQGVTTLGLTDHDTMAGAEEALAAGHAAGVRVVPGIELSVRVPVGTFHLLGHFAEPLPGPLAERLDEIGAAREARNRAMVDRLAELGAPVAWADVARRARGRIGRPHIADAVVAAGHAADREDAFVRYLADDAPAYIPAGVLEPEEAVRLVKAAGGTATVAHPRSLKLAAGALEAFLGRLAAVGLDAVECHRGDQSPEEQEAMTAVARRLGLLDSGGSDFHRPQPANVERRLGHTGVPGLRPEVVEELLARRRPVSRPPA
jgi:hypothetical protein